MPEIRPRLCPKILDLAGRGWSARDIAWALDCDLVEIREFLARPLTDAERAAIERHERERLERCIRPPKWVDEWKAAAADGDERYRDVAAGVRLEAPVKSESYLPTGVCAELPAMAAAELDQGDVNELPRTPVAESWGSPHGGGNTPRKITAAVLTEALALHQAGWSWPRIAQKFGCHRMAFYHALRR
jgi:hypothetical protein